MKKCLTLIAVSFFVHAVCLAQMKQGSILVGGDIRGYSEKSDGGASVSTPARNNGFSFTPSAALALHDNFYAGIRLNFGHSVVEGMSNGIVATTQKTSQFGGGIFLREYRPLGARFYIFMEEDLSAGGTNTTNSDSGSMTESTEKATSVVLGIYPGISYAVTSHFQLETGLQNFFSVGYERTKYSSGTRHSFFAGTAFSQTFENLYLGVRFLFGD